MNTLEKILEEIKKEKNSYEADHAWNYSKALERAEEIIRSHMNEGKNRNVPSDDGWIPVSERLPEEHDSIFAKLKGTDKWNKAMFEKISDEVNATIEYEDGSRKTTTSYTLYGVWKIEKEQRIVKQKVIAWQPLPEPYKEGK